MTSLDVAADAGEGPTAARLPLYRALASALMKEIDSGRYAAGQPLPTEAELALQHGVSRHTVRQALRELKEEGLISARAGIGTMIRARQEPPRFFSGINSVAELLQFVGSTQMHVVSRRRIVVGVKRAAQLHCRPGEVRMEIGIVRIVPGGTLPLSYLQVYLKPEYADVIGAAKVLTRPIYSLVEARHGVRIVEVQQEITAASLTRPMARLLAAREGQAALRISRYYLDRSGSLVEVGIGHYPSGRYTQNSRFRAHGPRDLKRAQGDSG
jgi:DNA-binding GntR family transcriptional regulator